MADNRKYYYLKLKENFFDSDSIVLLEDMKDGILYSNILLKLYLKSLKNGGKLQLDEHIPYTAQMIATLTRHQIGTVERALEIFRQLGLVVLYFLYFGFRLDSGSLLHSVPYSYCGLHSYSAPYSYSASPGRCAVLFYQRSVHIVASYPALWRKHVCNVPHGAH